MTEMNAQSTYTGLFVDLFGRGGSQSFGMFKDTFAYLPIPACCCQPSLVFFPWDLMFRLN